MTGIVAGIFFIENLNRVVAKRSLYRCPARSLRERLLHFSQNRETITDFNKVLDNARVLTHRTIEFLGQSNVFKHRVVNNLGHIRRLFGTQFFKLCLDIIGKMFAKISREVCHHVGELFNEFSLIFHDVLLS